MKCRVAITGLGIFCSVGSNVEEFHRSLTEGRSGIGPVTLFDTSPYPSRIGAEIRDFQAGPFPGERGSGRLSRADRFALIAAAEAIRTSVILSFPPEKVGISLGAGAGGMLEAEAYHRDTLLKGRARPSLITSFIPSATSDRVAERFGLQGPRITVTTACSSSATAIGYGADWIQTGRVKAVLCGGSEALSELTFGGFNSLRVMDPAPCRPFDRKRAGMSLGEGAAFLVLESYEGAVRRGATVYAEFLGYALGGEAYHMTAPEPGGRREARIMEEAIAESGLSPDAIDAINAHGTGTPLNDKVESLAIKKVFGERARSIPVSSTKSTVGHCLGAAGAIEAVTSVLSILHRFVPSTLNHREGDADCDLDYVPERPRHREVRMVLSNSFAFGGNGTTLIFGKR